MNLKPPTLLGLSLLGSICNLKIVAEALNVGGKILSVPDSVFLTGSPAYSWWYSSAGPYTADWKDQQRKLSNAQVLVQELQEGIPRDQLKQSVVKVDDDGSFTLSNLSAGQYLLIPSHIAYKFSPILLSLSDGSEEGVKIFKIDGNKGVKSPQKRLKSLLIRPDVYESPYPDPKPLNVFAYLKSPLVWMCLGPLFVSYILPKMTEGIDMEALNDQSQSSSSASNAATAFKSSFVSKLSQLKNSQ